MIRVDDPPARPRLGDGDGEAAHDYVFLRSVQLKNGVPYALVNLHLERGIYARSPESFLTRTALPILATMKGADIEHAHQTLVIGSADPATAALLKVPLGTPTAECHCVVNNSRGVAIYVAEIIYRNDCVKLHIDLLDKSKANGAGRVQRTERAAAGTARPKNGSRAERRNPH